MCGDLLNLAVAGYKSDSLPFRIHHEEIPILAKADCGPKELVLLLSAENLD